MTGAKAAGALRTIGEVTQETGVAAHILRFWETRFPQLRPLQRAGGRRYYRADDVALVRRIGRLLGEEGYTIRGVQQLLAGESERRPTTVPSGATAASVRALLVAALAADDA